MIMKFWRLKRRRAIFIFRTSDKRSVVAMPQPFQVFLTTVQKVKRNMKLLTMALPYQTLE